MFVLPPPIKSFFNDSQLFGVMIVGVRGALGVVLGVCGYLLVFGTPNSKWGSRIALLFCTRPHASAGYSALSRFALRKKLGQMCGSFLETASRSGATDQCSQRCRGGSFNAGSNAAVVRRI